MSKQGLCMNSQQAVLYYNLHFNLFGGRDLPIADNVFSDEHMPRDSSEHCQLEEIGEG